MFKNSNFIRSLFYLLLFAPLFFINIKSSHDWGDDFAQYISQASNIVEGKSQSTVGYIFNPDQPFVGPPTYSAGFPLLLSPVYSIFGNNVLAFNYFNTLLLLITGILMIYFFKLFFPELIAILLSIIIVYNPWTINFKCEILSDIPFSLILLICTLLYLKIRNNSQSTYSSIMCGFSIGFLILVRSVGVVFIIAILADASIKIMHHHLLNKQKIKEGKGLIISITLILLSCFATYFLIGSVLFPSNSSTFQYFKTLYSSDGIQEIFLRNLTYYIENFQRFFQPQTTVWTFIPLLIKALALSLFFIGYINSIIKKISFIEVLFAAYIASICFFPNSTQGFRYLLPLMPFLMFYIVLGFQSINFSRQINRRFIAISLTCICLLSYRTELSQIIEHQKQILQGPQEPEAKEAFNYIKSHTQQSDTIAFIKPRALALYTGRYSFTNHPEQDSASISKKFQQFKPHYFLLMNDIENPALRSYINRNSTKMELLFKNSKFEFYKRLH